MLCTLTVGIIIILILLKLFAMLTVGRDRSTICLVGKTAIVTGGYTGMGAKAAQRLATRGCKVYIADIVNSETTVQNIISETNNPNVHYMYLDLGSLASTRKFAEEFRRKESKLDILINNAGCGGYQGVYSKDGILKWLQINYIGPVLLTHLLVDLIKKSDKGRIVFVASIMMYNMWSLTVSQLNVEPTFFFGQSHVLYTILDYSKSKLLTGMAARNFGKLLAKEGITVSSVHPGYVYSDFYTNCLKNQAKSTFLMTIFMWSMDAVGWLYAKSVYEGVECTMHCALSPNIENCAFYIDCIKFAGPQTLNDSKLLDDVWKESVKLAQLKEDELLH